MYVYVRTHTVADIYITVEFLPCPRCYLSSLSYFWGLGAREGDAMLSRQSYYILNFHHPFRPSLVDSDSHVSAFSVI